MVGQQAARLQPPWRGQQQLGIGHSCRCWGPNACCQAFWVAMPSYCQTCKAGLAVNHETAGQQICRDRGNGHGKAGGLLEAVFLFRRDAFLRSHSLEHTVTRHSHTAQLQQLPLNAIQRFKPNFLHQSLAQHHMQSPTSRHCHKEQPPESLPTTTAEQKWPLGSGSGTSPAQPSNEYVNCVAVWSREAIPSGACTPQVGPFVPLPRQPGGSLLPPRWTGTHWP